eukprot:gnl/MRDRNA2_/MRDRNA2_160848_c0_seq1.p1 gnl/MRDRNA2_/MRDRNA2_160848_c0~~gnl/MRDRNA2_/MRDRNA2_160848_c0_seq1.p1  ORF type:complete len:279 (-),score=44.74 gnl/MRDRNA2_/MRDRNA2_160848_c0_seq1:3-839(-)
MRLSMGRTPPGKLKYQMLNPSEMGDVQLLPPSMPSLATHLDFKEADGDMVSYHLDGTDAEEEELPDMDSFKRAEIRASVFDTYAICSALFAGFSVSQPSFNSTAIAVVKAYSSVDKHDFRITALHIQQWLLYVCTAGGVYACTIFTFCALYSKTALAHPTHGLELLDAFLKQTQGYRRYAFYSMYSTSILFSSSLVWNVFQSFQVKQGLVAVFPLLFVIGFTVLHSGQLLNAASPIFVHAEKIEKEMEKERAAKKADTKHHKDNMHIPNLPNPNEAIS